MNNEQLTIFTRNLEENNSSQNSLMNNTDKAEVG